MRWPLQPLLDLRTREEEEATWRLVLAEKDRRIVEAEAAVARAEAAAAAERVLRVGPSSRLAGMASTGVAGEERFRGRLRLEAARRGRLAAEAELRLERVEAMVERQREALRVTAVRREVVAELGMAWRREKAETETRRAEADLDDRAWRPAGCQQARLSASRPAAARPAPGRTGW